MNLHPQLEKDSEFIAELPLCQLRLIPDGDNEWFLLIPRKDNMVDWSDLSEEDQQQLTREINVICLKLKEICMPDKLNVASLGNMVPQLHVHVIARYKNDRAWPGPIWGTKANSKFAEEKLLFWREQFEVLTFKR